MYYTNGSTITKTFHGVTFGPGETKEVFAIINDPKFVLSSARKEPPKREEVKSSEVDSTLVFSSKSKRGRKPSYRKESVEVATSDNEETTEGSIENKLEVDKLKEV